MTRLSKTFAALVILCVILFGTQIFRRMDSERPIRIVGIGTWIGYGPLFVAQELGLFEKYGTRVDIRIMDGPGERETAFASGKLDFFPNTPDAFVIFFANQPGLGGKIVAVLGESSGADGIVARLPITSIPELKGKSIGYQQGSTSHFFLLLMLDRYGLMESEVQSHNMETAAAGAAFASGNLDAAVVWEPWLSATKAVHESKILATSKETPGLLVDLMLASDRMIHNEREVLGFVHAWQEAIEYVKNYPAEATMIMAKNLNIPENEARDMMPFVRYFNEIEMQEYVNTRLPEVLATSARLYRNSGVINKMPEFSHRIWKPLSSRLFTE